MEEGRKRKKEWIQAWEFLWNLFLILIFKIHQNTFLGNHYNLIIMTDNNFSRYILFCQLQHINICCIRSNSQSVLFYENPFSVTEKNLAFLKFQWCMYYLISHWTTWSMGYFVDINLVRHKKISIHIYHAHIEQSKFATVNRVFAYSFDSRILLWLGIQHQFPSSHQIPSLPAQWLMSFTLK